MQTTTADGTGTVSYPLDFPGGTTSGSVTVTEAQQAGFTLQPVNGQNAVCTNLNTGACRDSDREPDATGSPSTCRAREAVNCIVYNRAPNPEADITVDKNWVVNGVAYAERRAAERPHRAAAADRARALPARPTRDGV